MNEVFAQYFQANVALDEVSYSKIYPMDYYTYDSLGNWTVNHSENRPERRKQPRKVTNASKDSRQLHVPVQT